MTDGIAIYGAITGTAGAIGVLWAIWHAVFRDRPKVVLRIGREFYSDEESDAAFAIVSYEPREWPAYEALLNPEHRKVHLVVTNAGRRPITINSAGLEFPNYWRAALQPGVSGEIGEGRQLTYRVSERAMKELLRRSGSGLPQVLFAMDASNKPYRQPVPAGFRAWLALLTLDAEGELAASTITKEENLESNDKTTRR